MGLWVWPVTIDRFDPKELQGIGESLDSLRLPVGGAELARLGLERLCFGGPSGLCMGYEKLMLELVLQDPALLVSARSCSRRLNDGRKTKQATQGDRRNGSGR